MWYLFKEMNDDDDESKIKPTIYGSWAQRWDQNVFVLIKTFRAKQRINLAMPDLVTNITQRQNRKEPAEN